MVSTDGHGVDPSDSNDPGKGNADNSSQVDFDERIEVDDEENGFDNSQFDDDHSADSATDSESTDSGDAGANQEDGAEEEGQPEGAPVLTRRQRKRRQKIDRVVMEFQPDAVELEKTPVPGGARFTLYTIFLLIVAAIAWAWWAKVDRIVIGQGQLVNLTKPIMIQPLAANKIREIKVKFGDTVRTDDVLATLDPTFAIAEFSAITSRVESLSAAEQRLRCELNGTEYFPDSSNPHPSQLLEKQIFDAQNAAFNAKADEYAAKIREINGKIETNKAAQKDYDNLLELFEKEAKSDKKGLENGIVSESDVISHKKAFIEFQTQMRMTKAREDEFMRSLETTRKELATLKADRKSQISNQLVKVRNDLVQQIEQQVKAKRMKDLIELRVPKIKEFPDGQEYMVVEVAEGGTGSVLREGQPLIKLIPKNGQFEAEFEIQGKDIARIRELDSVSIKLNSFPYQKHDKLTGSVKSISETSFEKEQGGQKLSYYKAIVEITPKFYQQDFDAKGADNLDGEKESIVIDAALPAKGLEKVYIGDRLLDHEKDYVASRQRITFNEPLKAGDKISVRWEIDLLKEVPKDFRLMPGMAAQGEIKVGTRRVIDYFLYPLIRTLDGSIREP